MYFRRSLLSAGAMLIALPISTLANEAVELEPVTITGTKEYTLISETSSSTSQVSQKDIDFLKPSHPSEAMNRMPGVYVNVTGGEGHMTAIRQPISTSPLYLYLEDGIPTRSTGFFNHNAMYEINVPQSAGIEVSKGPGTALYGSDAIGAVINVSTKAAPESTEGEVNLEIGGHGWKRLLLGGGTASLNHGIRSDINITHTDGWRDDTEYDRQSVNFRVDSHILEGAKLKTLLNMSNIDQQTAGSSRLRKADYKDDPTKNLTPISFRKVQSLRLSTSYEKEIDDSLYTLTPYFRYNSMELLPNWSLGYDPVTYKTQNNSAGLLVKYRHDFAPMRTRIIIGTDVDYSPGSRDENEITVTKTGDIYTGYTEGDKIYDYDVAFSSASPYIHAQTSLTEKLRINAGLRFDYMQYKYSDNLSTTPSAKHQRPKDTDLDYQHFSPKLGATYSITNNINTFASYKHAFRVPSENQLFRQGKSVNTLDLKPVKVDSYEVGLRGKTDSHINYEVSVYYMEKKDDILTYKDNSTGTEIRTTVNAGKTLHKGVEVGLDMPLASTLDIGISYAYTEHTYDDWKIAGTTDYSGNTIASAPKDIANIRLAYHPDFMRTGKIELEATHLGKYWMDQANTETYAGHQLLNIRVDYPVTKQFNINARLLNIADTTYATNSSYSAPSNFSGEKFEYAPGMPRTAYIAANYRF